MIMNQINQLLHIIELFAERRRPLTLTQIADALDLPKSTAHNMIETLSSRGYLYEVRTRGGYYPSRRLLSVAEMIALGDPITSIIQDFLRKLAFETGETTLLAVRDKNYVIYLDVVESKKPVRYAATVGDRRPVYATSGGKAILSTYPEDLLEKTLKSLDFSDGTEATIKDADELRANLKQGEQAGYFLNCSEYTAEVTGIGIPIVVEGRTLGLSIAGPNHRMQGRNAELFELLRRSADHIAAALEAAGIGPSSHLRKV